MSRGPTQQIRYSGTLRVSSVHTRRTPTSARHQRFSRSSCPTPPHAVCACMLCACAEPPAEDDQRPSSRRAESAQKPSRCDSLLKTGVSSPSSRRITMSSLVGCHLNVRRSTRSEVRRGHRHPTAQDAEVRGGMRARANGSGMQRQRFPLPRFFVNARCAGICAIGLGQVEW